MSDTVLAAVIVAAGLVVSSVIVAVGVVVAARVRRPAPAGAWPAGWQQPLSSAGNPVEPSGIPVGPETDLDVGSAVLAYSQGRWWRAQVLALEPDGLVRIHYPGWDSSWDESVPREQLQVDLHGGE